jgi:alkanesulfonate monooxygenase SsuD/methylene tetrahydromethanopterin reductase-like flavin-dependent oxidoreductase (luciferase family)
MKFGFVAPNGNTDQILSLATEIEANGWDGFFTWDGIAIGDGQMDVYDPWAILAAAAVKTERVTLGAMIFPLSRRRPWVVARQALTVDHLSNGRLVIPVGLGAMDDAGFARVRPEATERKERAERLDETLDILERAWTGEPFTYEGKHYQLDDLRFTPQPVQQPRIPIWVVGAWPYPKSMARAARWDGIVPAIAAHPFERATPDEIADVCAWIAEHRTTDAPFEVVIEGVSPGDDPAWATEILQPLADAGATWWIESRWEAPNDYDTLLARVRQGPPR